MKFEDFISRLVQNPIRHAQFVNTLSFLEYVGARKILKSQRAQEITTEILAHVSEEVRHAQILKKVALKMSEGQLTSYDPQHLICGSDANLYIQTIDRSVEKELQVSNPWLNYLYSTLFIEERANQIYPIYEKYLADAGFPGILKAIVKEEDMHMKFITEALQGKKGLCEESFERLRKIESDYFARFLSQVIDKAFPSSQIA